MAISTASPNVLVALDGSNLAECAVPYALAVRTPGSVLVLINAVPDPEPVHGLLGNTVTTKDDVTAIYRQTGQLILDAASEHLAAEIPVQKIVTVGDPAEEILRTIPEKAVGLVVIASHGRGALGRWTFGSVADRLARESPVPVLIVRPGESVQSQSAPPITRLVVPLDGSPLAAEALPVAMSLALHLKLPVSLIRALDVAPWLPPTPLGPGIAAPGEYYEQLSRELRTEAQTTLAAASARLTSAEVETTPRILDGPAYQTISDAVGPTDIIVLTSHGRGGVRRWLLGSVAERLVRAGPAPVLLVPASVRHR